MEIWLTGMNEWMNVMNVICLLGSISGSEKGNMNEFHLESCKQV